MKLMRKLEKQALARAAKEARKQQGKLISFSAFNKSTGLEARQSWLIGQSVFKLL